MPLKRNILVRPGILSDFKNAHLIEERHVTELVELLITATAVPFHAICMVTVQWKSHERELKVTTPHYLSYPDGDKNSEVIKKKSVNIDLLHAVVPKAVLATASLV